MVHHQALAQSLHEAVQVHATVERAEGGRVGVRTLGSSQSWHSEHILFGQRPAPLLQRAWRAFLGEADGYSE